MGTFFSKENNNRIYNYKNDIIDSRDHLFKCQSEIKNEVDLRDNCPPIYNQGDLGSCTANSLAFIYEYDELKQNVQSEFTPSRLFIYYNERSLEGTINSDSGASLRDGIKTMVNNGVCTEDEWPYDIKKYQEKPPPECYDNAKSNIAIKYQKVEQDEESIKSVLSENYPISFGFSVYESFESDNVSKTGIVPMPNTDSEKLLGGHAVALVGYCMKDNQEYFIVRNSWGDSWGDNGYCYFPKEYILNSNLSNDFWVIEKVSTE